VGRDGEVNQSGLAQALGVNAVHEILVLDAGHIIERGTHAQLLAADGRYAQMWSLQQSQEESA
jgi:ABC-type transport system involved in cytochrome bd biosynthesis fused ATPase/permease subunit